MNYNLSIIAASNWSLEFEAGFSHFWPKRSFTRIHLLGHKQTHLVELVGDHLVFISVKNLSKRSTFPAHFEKTSTQPKIKET